MQHFSGSYAPTDVQFLLKPIDVPNTPIADKEALIQSGHKHYAELLTHETAPSPDYLALFHAALRQNRLAMARHLLILARDIAMRRSNPIALVSLARAGTPVGVLLKHVLQRYFSRSAQHYSISIIRDLGIDHNALRHILRHHPPEAIAFIDGWTGKGAIAEQLATSLTDFARECGVILTQELFVLSDLAGVAACAATDEDYLIPSSILNATVSGLISRSVYTPADWPADDYHGCLYYHWLRPYDLSRFFISDLLDAIAQLWRDGERGHGEAVSDPSQRRQISLQVLDWVKRRYGVVSSHHVKPGIGEATRVLLRRHADRLLLRDAKAEAVRHLRWLAEQKNVPIEHCPTLPYHAIALIKTVRPVHD